VGTQTKDLGSLRITHILKNEVQSFGKKNQKV